MLLVDVTQNLEGWEHKASERVYRSMKRRKVQVVGPEAFRPTSVMEFASLLEGQGDYNCLLVMGQGQGEGVEERSTLKVYLDPMLEKQRGAPLALVAVWTCGRSDPELRRKVIHAKDLAPIALASESDLGPHEGFVFFSRFFEELDLHCPQAITPAMARFAYLKTRHFSKGKIEIRL